MANSTASEIVFSHVYTNPEAFLQALQTRTPEVQKAVLDYMETLPKIGEETGQTNDQQTRPS